MACCHPPHYTVPPSDALQNNFFQDSNHIFNICFIWWKTEGKNYGLCAGLMGTDLRLNLIWKNRKVLLCYYHLCWCIWYWAASGDWANRRQWQKETSKGGISLLWTVHLPEVQEHTISIIICSEDTPTTAPPTHTQTLLGLDLIHCEHYAMYSTFTLG